MAAVEAPWGLIRLAADDEAVVALDVLSSEASFGAACLKRFGAWPRPTAQATASSRSSCMRAPHSRSPAFRNRLPYPVEPR